MIAIDSSVLIAYLNGIKSNSSNAVDKALTDNIAILPPFVVSEVLSFKNTSKELEETLDTFPIIDILPSFWARAGKTRSQLLNLGYKARMANTFIAQACIDHGFYYLSL
jgi:predicted nucleic acid-binding protein